VIGRTDNSIQVFFVENIYEMTSLNLLAAGTSTGLMCLVFDTKIGYNLRLSNLIIR